MGNKAVINVTTGLEDSEKVSLALLSAIAAAEGGRPTLAFLTKEAVRLVTTGVARGVSCKGCPDIAELMERFVTAGGRFMACSLCFGARGLDADDLIAHAEVAGTVQLWEWIGDEAATTFSY
ncbi:MAG: DsrE family protein [Acidimicrobiia bacterium]|nr:DsrE family protein [Acidimicrobiia bacterium]